MPAAEVIKNFLGGAADVPAFAGPVAALAHADEIEQRSGAQRIMHDVPAGADPVRADRPRDRGRHPLHGDDTAPGDDAAKLRLGGAEQRFPHHRVHAVGADHELRLDWIAGFEVQLDMLRRLRQAVHLRFN